MKVSDQVASRTRPSGLAPALNGSIAVVLVFVCFQASLLALPVGGQLVSGKGNIDAAGKNMTVTAGDRSIFNFTKFNIATGEQVKFVQPSSTSSTLARATDGTPSEIFGRLESNGRLVLANAAGIYFRNGSSVSVGGLVAAAGNVKDAEYQSSFSRVLGVDLTGAVENAGSIESTGSVALLGRTVVNSGSIVAPKGTVTLMADESVIVYEADSDIAVERNYQIRLDDPVAEGSGGVSVKTASARAGAKLAPSEKLGVDHSGSITARSAFLGAGDIYAVGVRHTGKTRVSSTATVRAASKVEVSGSIDASSSEQVATNVLTFVKGSPAAKYVGDGAIEIFGETVEIKSGATLSARGNLQGGDIRISGADVTLESNVTLDVSGTGKGNAGSISVDGWNFLNIDGRLVARGGEDAGNGGQISLTSSSLISEAPALVLDVSAPNGSHGSVAKWDSSQVVVDPNVIYVPEVIEDDGGLVVIDKDGESGSDLTPIYYTLGGGRPVSGGVITMDPSFLRGNLDSGSGRVILEKGVLGLVASQNLSGSLTLQRGSFELERPRTVLVSGAPMFQMGKAITLAAAGGVESNFASRGESLAVGDAFSGSVFGITSGVTGESASGQQAAGE